MKRALILGLLLFGMNAQADPKSDPLTETKKKQLELLKKAKYYEIQAKLVAEQITLKEAQELWSKNLKRLERKVKKEAV